MKLFIVLWLGFILVPSQGFSFWFDEKMGLDWELMSGRYPSYNVDSVCGGFSKGYRVPELEELRAAREDGIMDSSANGEFSDLIKALNIFHSKTYLLPIVQPIKRYTFNFDDGSWTEAAFPKTNDWRGLLCVAEPGHRRYWIDEAKKVTWKRGWGRSTVFAAKTGCLSPLENAWLSDIEELEDVYHKGIANTERNPVFGYALQKYGLVVSSSLVKKDEQGSEFYWALNTLDGRRVVVEGGQSYQYYHLCVEMFD